MTTACLPTHPCLVVVEIKFTIYPVRDNKKDNIRTYKKIYSL